MNVLVADDCAMVRYGLTDLINRQKGFRVVTEARNGNEIFLKLDQQQIDIVIMDLSMPPGESGLVTVKRINERYPQMKIIIFSMQEDQSVVNQSLHNGADGYLMKNSPTSELLRALKRVCANRGYCDPNILLTEDDIRQISLNGRKLDLIPNNGLSNREQELLPLIALGYTNKEVANKLFISTKTVEAHKASIMRKLSLACHVDLIHYAVHNHLIEF